MVTFDFITHEDFRGSLDADLAEMLNAFKAKAWKAVHVLAGSIIEAVLLDYLTASNYLPRDGKPLLELDLGKAIKACKAEGVLSDRTEQLSVAVKDYRNLIHPGRAVRLSEQVNESTAKVVQGLVEIIVSEVARRKAEKYGNTAEQLVAKLIADPNAIDILDHLQQGMHETEKERLLLKVIPDQYFALLNGDWDAIVASSSSREALQQCFRRTLEQVPTQVKTRVADKAISIITTAGGQRVASYVNAFLQASDAEHASDKHKHVIKDYLLARLKSDQGEELLAALTGIGSLLETSDMMAFFKPLINVYSRHSPTSYEGVLAKSAYTLMSNEYDRLRPPNQSAAEAAIDEIVGSFDTATKRIRGRLEPWRIKFQITKEVPF